MNTTIARDAICIVLTGGVGSRLEPLTQERTKPAVPICGQYRIIDFTLSNCLHSGLRRILVLTQYKSHSLHKHLRDAWGMFSPELDEYVLPIPPQQRTGDSWYSGTADAIYQNLLELRKSKAEYVMILSGDHIYRMDYAAMLQRHRQTEADVSVACMEVSLEDARSFGVLAVDSENRIQRFDEKPQHLEPSPNNSEVALASMGIYVFLKDVLCQELERDSQDAASSHDFGKDVLPRMIHTHHVFGYRYGDSEVGDSMLSNGVIVSGGTVDHSIPGPGVRVASGGVVEDSVLYEGVWVGEGTHLRNCIVDKGARIPAGETIGLSPSIDRQRFTVSEHGVTVIPKDYQFVAKAVGTLIPPTACCQTTRHSNQIGRVLGSGSRRDFRPFPFDLRNSLRVPLRTDFP